MYYGTHTFSVHLWQVAEELLYKFWLIGWLTWLQAPSNKGPINQLILWLCVPINQLILWLCVHALIHSFIHSFDWLTDWLFVCFFSFIYTFFLSSSSYWRTPKQSVAVLTTCCQVSLSLAFIHPVWTSKFWGWTSSSIVLSQVVVSHPMGLLQSVYLSLIVTCVPMPSQ